MCRRTRQIVAFALGNHTYKTCQRLWNRIPWPYRHCLTFTDFWESWQKVVPAFQHMPVGKASGATNHLVRWYNTLRQHLSRFCAENLVVFQVGSLSSYGRQMVHHRMQPANLPFLVITCFVTPTQSLFASAAQHSILRNPPSFDLRQPRKNASSPPHFRPKSPETLPSPRKTHTD